MKLILIYGSPAVGKLTVARKLGKQTDYKVFHNHLTIDAVVPVFEFGSKSFWKLVHQFRIDTIAEAARENVDLVYTFCYAKDFDDAHVEEVEKAVVENGGELCLVLLTAERSEIERRVLEESRLKYKKAATLELLHGFWEKFELFSPVNDRESLIIDNTNLSAEETAKRIIEHFDLKDKG